jgi:chemotaxis protein CheD
VIPRPAAPTAPAADANPAVSRGPSPPPAAPNAECPAASDVHVKVADYAAARGEVVIATVGLGSCVAVAVYDAQARVGALAHVLLPSESLSRDRGNRAKFATSAVPLLVEQVRALGARGPLAAKLAGGASMFAQLLPSGGINIGERNVEAVLGALAAAGIPVAARDTGGDFGRSVFFHVIDARMVVRSLKRGEIVL